MTANRLKLIGSGELRNWPIPKVAASLRPLSGLGGAVIRWQARIGDVVFPSSSGDMPIVAYRKMWLRIAKLGGLPADIMPHILRHSFASLATDLGYNEPTIASLLGHKTHSITSRYVYSADAVANASTRPTRLIHLAADPATGVALDPSHQLRRRDLLV